MYWCGIIIFKMTVNEMLNLSPDLLRPWLIQQTPFIQLFHQSTTHFLNQLYFHDIFPNGSNAKLSPDIFTFLLLQKFFLSRFLPHHSSDGNIISIKIVESVNNESLSLFDSLPVEAHLLYCPDPQLIVKVCH